MNALVDQIVDFIIDNYDDADFTDRMALECFVRQSKNIHIEHKDGEIELLAIFFKVNDAAIGRIATDNRYQDDPAFIQECMNQNGENIHVFMAIHKGDKSSMLRCVRNAVAFNNPRTVSWYDPEMTRFHIKTIRRSQCLPQ